MLIRAREVAVDLLERARLVHRLGERTGLLQLLDRERVVPR